MGFGAMLNRGFNFEMGFGAQNPQPPGLTTPQNSSKTQIRPEAAEMGFGGKYKPPGLTLKWNLQAG